MRVQVRVTPAGVSVEMVWDLGQGRTHRPEQGSMGKLAGVPGLDDARLQAFARARGSLPNLGLDASRG